MSSNLQGMDTEHAREVSGQMDSHAAQASSVCSALYSRLQATKWYGPDMERMRGDMEGSFIPESTNCAETLREQAGVLARHADAQDAVSS